MFRTEVVASKNFRKTVYFKIYNAFAIIVFVALLVIMSNVFGPETTIGQFVANHYNDIIRPVILGVALVIFLINMFFKNSMKTAKRIGSIEMDENELKFLIEDELQESISFTDVNSIDFEFFSFRLRSNPVGGMNYLTIHTKSGDKTYEIVIANSMVKAEFGELLSQINAKTPVKVTYSNFVKKMMKDNDFKF